MNDVTSPVPPPGNGRTAALAAFTAGFVDTVGFVALFGLFTAHVTGNFVLIGAAIVTHHTGIIAKLLALPVFILAVAATTVLIRRGRSNPRLTVGYVLFGQAVLLMAFMAAGLLLAPFRNGDQPTAILTGMIGVLAMGVQNAAARILFAHMSPTTVMTGNVTQIVIDVVELLHGPSAEAKARIGKMLPPVCAFALGAIGGGLGFVNLGFWCLSIAVVAVFATLLTLVPFDFARARRGGRHG